MLIMTHRCSTPPAAFVTAATSISRASRREAQVVGPVVSSYGRRRPWRIIAHRGASVAAPESTRAAILAAARAGASMVELDVQMTRDGRLVVFHDADVRRTTDGTGRVRAMPYARLARLDAGAWFHPRFAGERILLVSQVFRLVPTTMRINLELKPTRARGLLIRRLRRIIRSTGARGRLLVSSFDPALLRLLVPARLPLALICRRDPERSLRQAIRLGCAAWHPFHALVTSRRVARAHAAGVAVHAWTVDRAVLARRMRGCGVDGIFTNDPGRFRRRR